MSKLKTLITAYEQKGGTLIIPYLSQLFTDSKEIKNANLHEMVNPGKQLGVDGEPAVEFVPRLSYQALSKLPLEHKNCAPG